MRPRAELVYAARSGRIMSLTKSLTLYDFPTWLGISTGASLCVCLDTKRSFSFDQFELVDNAARTGVQLMQPCNCVHELPLSPALPLMHVVSYVSYDTG